MQPFKFRVKGYTGPRRVRGVEHVPINRPPCPGWVTQHPGPIGCASTHNKNRALCGPGQVKKQQKEEEKVWLERGSIPAPGTHSSGSDN